MIVVHNCKEVIDEETLHHVWETQASPGSSRRQLIVARSSCQDRVERCGGLPDDVLFVGDGDLLVGYDAIDEGGG